jgi:Asp-tRNA(Asn)/Glu-tRNA(Gln) amidotransferase A subunit family amidase
VRKLRDAGAVIIGKTNLHELAYGITTISSMGGQTHNPYNPTRNPGGSSGGTGAAVAANFALAGMGTDTCGSIRIPAANNNLFGLRGTAGLSSRDGIIPLSHTQDIGGPLARTVTDLALMLDATVGFDAADPTTGASQGHVPSTYLGVVGVSSLKDVRIGIVTSLFGSAPEDAEVGGIVRDAIDVMRRLGASVSEITIPGYDELMRGTSVIDAEFKFDLMDYLAQFPGAPVRSLDEILSRGLYHNAVDGVLRRANAVGSRDSETYRAALARREAARQAVVASMQLQELTTLAYPTLRREPAPIGEPQVGSNCQLSATTGLPAIGIPAGFTRDGLPVGLELLGGAFSEPMLLRAAFAYERETHPRRPPPTTPSLVVVSR